METEPEKHRGKKNAPSRWLRLTWWFGILAAGFGPLIIFAMFFYRTPAELIVTFPVMLGTIFELPLSNLLPQFTGREGPGIHAFLCYAGPAIYICHLMTTLWVRTRRSFDFLLGTLIVLLIANYCILAFYFYIFRDG